MLVEGYVQDVYVCTCGDDRKVKTLFSRDEEGYYLHCVYYY